MQQPGNNKILKRLKLQYSQNKPLLLAVIISLLLHTSLLTKFAISLPESDKGHQVLEMRLVNVQAAQKPTAVPVKPNAPAPVSEPVKTTETLPSPQASINTSPTGELPASVTEPALELPPETAPQIAQSSTPPTSEKLPANSIETIDTTLGYIANKPRPQVYKYVETEFDVIRSGDTTASGVTNIKYSVQDNNTYELTSVTAPKEHVSTTLGTLHQKSEGTASETGLRPNYYQYQSGNDSKNMQSAILAWSDGIIVMYSAKGEKTETLNQGTQDLLSFMYQFMFSPLLMNNEISMTNGKNLRTYTYSFQGQVLLKTELGELRTIHLLKAGDDEAKTELWLALDYQNLPVKIRITEIDGSFIEQIATKINTLKQ